MLGSCTDGLGVGTAKVGKGVSETTGSDAMAGAGAAGGIGVGAIIAGGDGTDAGAAAVGAGLVGAGDCESPPQPASSKDTARDNVANASIARGNFP